MLAARMLFQQLNEIVAHASIANPMSQQVTPRGSRPGTPRRPTPSPGPSSQPQPGSVAAALADVMSTRGESPQPKVTKASQQAERDNDRPNVHVGLHYAAIVAEYGQGSNCNVLMGEDKHR